MAKKKPPEKAPFVYRALSEYLSSKGRIDAVRQAMEDGHSNKTAAELLKTTTGTIAGIRFKNNIPSKHSAPASGAARKPKEPVVKKTAPATIVERPVSKDPKKMSAKDRVRFIVGLFEANTPIDEICKQLGGERDDLREFIRLNSPENLATFDALVSSEGESEEEPESDTGAPVEDDVEIDTEDDGEDVTGIGSEPDVSAAARAFAAFHRKRRGRPIEDAVEPAPRQPLAGPPKPAYVDPDQMGPMIPQPWWPDPSDVWGDEKRPKRVFAVTEAIQCVWGKSLGRTERCGCERESEDPDLCAYHQRAYKKFRTLRKPARSA